MAARLAQHKLQAPLLERLVATERSQPFDEQALAESVRAELTRLFNSRRASTHKSSLTVLDYGIADWTALSSQRHEDQRLLLREIRAAITFFEPRLALTELSLEPGNEPHQLLIRLSGMLRCGRLKWPASFLINSQASTIEVEHA